MIYKIGDDFPVWWNTDRPKVNGFYPGRIIAARSYTGAYEEHYT